MNTKLTKTLLLCLALMATTACNDKPLPGKAQATIDSYFPKCSVVLVETETESGVEQCEVWLNDGTKIEFDMEGEWQRVSRKKSGVPASMIPPAIMEYIKKNYPRNIVTKLSKKDYGYKIELSDDMDLRFDRQFQFIEEID